MFFSHGRHVKRHPLRKRITIAALSVIAGVLLLLDQLTGAAYAKTLSFNQLTSSYAKQFIGDSYAWGGTGPSYDCSGLAQAVYRHFGKTLEHTAEWDYTHGKIIPKSKAWGGDLVVFLWGNYAYHVGIYEGGNSMVSALNPYYGVRQTPLSWGGSDYVFVTFSH